MYWLNAGGLYRDAPLGPVRVGAVLEGQTRFAVGNSFGVGFYRAGNFSTLFTFDVLRVGLREDPAALQLAGTLLGARFALSDTHAWIFTTVRDRAQVRQSLLVVDAAGRVLGRLEDSALPVGGAATGAGAGAGLPEWLTSLQADPVAVGPLLFVPTDRGVVRVELVGGVPTVTREFPDTEPFVDSATPLLFDGRGLIAVQTQRILQLQMS